MFLWEQSRHWRLLLSGHSNTSHWQSSGIASGSPRVGLRQRPTAYSAKSAQMMRFPTDTTNQMGRLFADTDTGTGTGTASRIGTTSPMSGMSRMSRMSKTRFELRSIRVSACSVPVLCFHLIDCTIAYHTPTYPLSTYRHIHAITTFIDYYLH